VSLSVGKQLRTTNQLRTHIQLRITNYELRTHIQLRTFLSVNNRSTIHNVKKSKKCVAFRKEAITNAYSIKN